MLGGRITQTLLDGKKLNFVHSQGVGMQNFLIFPYSLELALSLVLVPCVSHLVKISLPNISYYDASSVDVIILRVFFPFQSFRIYQGIFV